jgi:hypothetical protein
LNNRLKLLCDRLLAPNQIDFVKGKYILESVFTTHEIIHGAMGNREKAWSLNWTMKKRIIELIGIFLRKCLSLEVLALSGGLG